MKLAIALVSLLLAAPFARQPAESATSLVGTWVGHIEHNGQTSPIAIEFEPHDNEVRAVLVVPAFHGRSPLGAARLNGSRVELSMMALDYDRGADMLSATLPEGLLPRYRPRMVFRRSSAPFPLPERPDPTAPRREPGWVADIGAPMWADAAFRDGKVFVGADDGRVRALDARTGRTIWTFYAGGAIRARSTFAGNDLLVQSDNGLLHRLDADTGRLQWQVRVADTAAVRIPLSDPKTRYEHRASAVTAHNDRVFLGTHEGRLLALRAASGERLWEFKAGDSITTTPAVADGRVYFGSFDRYVYAVDEANGSLQWKYDTGDAVTSDPVPTGDRVIVGSRSYDLESLDARSGTSQWKNYFWFSWVESSPVVYKNTIYIGSSDGAKTSAIDIATGKSIWQTDVLGSAWGRPAVTEATVFQGVAGVLRYDVRHRGVVMAMDRGNGRIKWWYEMAPPAPHEPPPPQRAAYGFAASVVTDNVFVFAPGLDGRLYAFRQ